ncbi:MAG: lipopolysaccharide assembly protein LapA domain-containing protein [Acidimicrobiales bacterium]
MSESDDQERVSPAVPLRESGTEPDDHRHREERFRHTRTSAAWVGIVVAIIFGVALIDFIAQNTHDVQVNFFSVNGQIPVAVALLVAALSGAIVVVAVGVGRVAQLRLTMRRQQRRHDAESAGREN